MCKTYTVGYMMGKEDTPFIRLSENWLKNQGFNIGDKLKYISSKNMIILIKMLDVETLEDKKAKGNKQNKKATKRITK